jgi:hypothetical protein
MADETAWKRGWSISTAIPGGFQYSRKNEIEEAESCQAYYGYDVYPKLVGGK